MNENPHDRGLREEQRMIQLHDEAHTFLKTALGQKLMDDIDEEVEDFVEQLKAVDAKDTDAVEKLQFEIWKREYLKVWFNTIILQGQAVLDLHDSVDSEF